MCLRGVDYSENSVVFADRVKQSLSSRDDVIESLRADYAKIEFEV